MKAKLIAFFIIVFVLMGSFPLNVNAAREEINDKSMTQFWITRFLLGTASDGSNKYTQFPTTFSNYFQKDPRATINWSTGGNKLSGAIGSKIQGTFVVPRQYIYTTDAAQFPTTQFVVAGARFYNEVPDKNEYQFRVNGFEKNSEDFKVIISEQTPYQMKSPVATSGQFEGKLADFQTFNITIERIRNATHDEDMDNGFWIDLDWIFNPIFWQQGWLNQFWYRGFKQTVNHAIRVNFQDEAIEKNLTASPVPQYYELGQSLSSLDSLVKNVKLGNQAVLTGMYTIQLLTSLSTDTIGQKNVKVKVTLKSDPTKTTDLDVPVSVMWGNSVVFGSNAYPDPGRTAAAFTLKTGIFPSIVASQGGTSDDNNQIHELFYGDQYYTFNWFNLYNRESIRISEDDDGNYYLKAKGYDLKKDKLKEWGPAQKQDVNYGDVVRAWQAEPSKNWLYVDEQKRTYNNNQKAVYYEITTTGYRPLHFNQLSTKKVDVPSYATQQYLNSHAKDFIDLKNYASSIDVVGFSEYPDTTTPGEKKGKVLVAETLTTGKRVEYKYEVILNIVPVESAPVTVKYLDENDNEIRSRIIMTGEVGQSYDFTTAKYKLPTIEKDGVMYQLNEEILPSNAKGTYSDKEQTVIYRYIKSKLTADFAQVKKGFRHADAGEKNKWTPTAGELKTWVTNVQLGGKPVTDYQVSLNGKTVDTEKVGTTDYTVTVSGAGTTTEVKVPVEITPGIFQVRDADVQRFAAGSEQPTDSTIKSWFNRKVDVVNEDGKIIEEGLGSTAYEVTLKSPWNSKEVGTKTFEAEVTYIGPGYQGKLKSNQAIGKIPIEFYTITAEPAQVKKGFRHADDGEKNKWTPTAEELKTWVTNVQLDGKPVTDYQVSLNGKTVDTEKVGTTDYTVTVSSAGATAEVKVPVEITPGIFQVRDADVQRFAVGSEQPTDSTIKSWFNGKVDVVNEDGKIIEEGLGSTAYEVTLKSPWNSKEVGTKTFEAEVTYIGPGYQGKLKSNQAIGKIPVEFDDSGTFVWDIPQQLGFQQAKTTSSKTQMIHRTEADWKINVTDTKEERKKWGITARLDKEFTHKKDTNKKMKNILKFQSAQHEIYTLNTDHSVPIYMTADDPPKAEDLEIKWGKDQGFYLEIPAYDYHVKGEYDATIEFTLEWTY